MSLKLLLQEIDVTPTVLSFDIADADKESKVLKVEFNMDRTPETQIRMIVTVYGRICEVGKYSK